MRRLVFAAFSGGLAIAASQLVMRYRMDLAAARSRLADVDRRLVATDWGAVEYAERGSGEPLLVLHGIFGGCDEASLMPATCVRTSSHRAVSVRLPRIKPAGRRDPGRPGDALAALLDSLGIDETDVIGISAGATSALQLALRP